MTTLTDFDSISNQNHSGMNLPEQCFVGAGLFSDAPMPCTSYGSGQYSTLFEDEDDFLIEDKYCTVPSLYSSRLNSNNNNNNSRTEQVPSTSSNCEEDVDDEEGSCLLSNLPNSCQDFEVKEMHIKLERNQSSPLVPGHVSPAQSGRLSSNCPSAEPPADPTEPEDLEVQWINESFEEQQKQSKMYHSGDLKTIFYNGSDQESSKGNSRSNTEKSACSPVERPERLPYVKKLLSQDSSHSLRSDSRPLSPAQLLKPEKSFEPLLTPKSEALIQRQIQAKVGNHKRRVSEPLARKPPLFWNTDSLSDLSACEGAGSDVFELSDSSTAADYTSARHVSFARDPEPRRHASEATPPLRLQQSSTACDDDTEKLALGIIASLFEGVGITPLTPTTDKVIVPWADDIVRAAPTASRRLDMGDTAANDDGRDTTSPDGRSSVGHLEPLPMEDLLGGLSWEDLDDELLTKQLEEAKLEAAAKVTAPKKTLNYYETPKTIEKSSWNKDFLKHVVEVYKLPEYKTLEDINAALALNGYGTANVTRLDHKAIFVAFDSFQHAQGALSLQNHPWLRLRPLAVAPPDIQRIAIEHQSELQPQKVRGKTNVGTARRMVEGALGKKSAVSREQRKAENKQLSDAKAAKQTTVKWDA